MADREIRDANTLLMAATEEIKVQDRLKALGFLRNIGIWIYTADGDSDPTNNPMAPCDTGPLWSIGD